MYLAFINSTNSTWNLILITFFVDLFVRLFTNSLLLDHHTHWSSNYCRGSVWAVSTHTVLSRRTLSNGSTEHLPFGLRKPKVIDIVTEVHKVGVIDGNSEISRLRSAAGDFLFSYSTYRTKAANTSSAAEVLIGSGSAARSTVFTEIIFDERNETELFRVPTRKRKLTRLREKVKKIERQKKFEKKILLHRSTLMQNGKIKIE